MPNFVTRAHGKPTTSQRQNNRKPRWPFSRVFLGSAPAAAFLPPVARPSGWTATPNQHLFRRWHNADHFALFRSIFFAASVSESSRCQTPECQQPGAAKAAPSQRINSRRHWLLHASGWRRHLCRGWHVPARVTPHADAAAPSARAAVPSSAAPGARRGKSVNQAPCRIISCRATQYVWLMSNTRGNGMNDTAADAPG